MRKIAANFIYPINSDPLHNGTLILDDDGTVLDLEDGADNFREQESVEFYNGIVVPGFVNSHCHLELSYLKDQIVEKLGLPRFLSSLVKKRCGDPDCIITPAIEAQRNMETLGITAVGDISNSPHTLNIKDNSRIKYHTFVEIWGNDTRKATDLFLKGVDLLRWFASGQQSASISPHSTYTLSEQLFRHIFDFCQGKNNIITIHNQETATENDLFRNNRGLLKETLEQLGDDLSTFATGDDSSLVATLKKLPNDQKILLVHNTYTTESDVVEANKINSSLFWVLCPRANLYIEDQLPNIPMLHNHKATLALGTDSLASNNMLSILEEMKTIMAYYPEIDLKDLLQWGTLNGATALGLEATHGSFEKGKKPGVNLIENIDFEGMKLKENSKVRVLL